jgi:hypothetical protein
LNEFFLCGSTDLQGERQSSVILVGDGTPLGDDADNGDGFSVPSKCDDVSLSSQSSSTLILPSTSSRSSFDASAPITDDVDIGLAVGKRHQLNRDKLFKFLKCTWVPGSAYQFPGVNEGNQMRKFQHQWLVDYDWLAYSAIKTGAFCKYCVLFTGDGVGATRANQVQLLYTLLSRN